MRWERFFDDLEDQLASEWEAERAALDTEAERLRLSRVELRDRLGALVGADVEAAIDLCDGTSVRGTVTAQGADWIALVVGNGRATMLIPVAGLVAIGLPHIELLRTARAGQPRSAIAERMTFGFVLRDLVRRRAGVVVHLASGRSLSGTIDRAGADHLDLALHEPGVPRRAEAITGFRLLPFSAIAAVRVDDPDARVI